MRVCRYDKDGNGTIDKEELFAVLLDLGQVVPPSAGSKAEKIDFLEYSFALADTNNDGSVDREEFVTYYSALLDANEIEQLARSAFDEYDIDRSNTLEKHELFKALIDLDLVPGLTVAERRDYLEEQYCVADTNGDGVVDFSEFVAFFANSRAASHNDAKLARQRVHAALQRERRLHRQRAYSDPATIFVAAREGDLALLSGRWLLQRAGYIETMRKRRAGSMSRWALPEDSSGSMSGSAQVNPLPPRQQVRPFPLLTTSLHGPCS